MVSPIRKGNREKIFKSAEGKKSLLGCVHTYPSYPTGGLTLPSAGYAVEEQRFLLLQSAGCNNNKDNAALLVLGLGFVRGCSFKSFKHQIDTLEGHAACGVRLVAAAGPLPHWPVACCPIGPCPLPVAR